MLTITGVYFCKAAADFVYKNLRMQILLSIHTVEPLYYGHCGTKYFWPLFAQYRGFPLSEVKNVLVTPVGTKIFVLINITEAFSIESLIWRVVKRGSTVYNKG